MNNEIYVGLIRGRHQLPTDQYIFDEIKDVHDYEFMYSRCVEFIKNNVVIETDYDIPLNGATAYDEAWCY